MIKISITNNRIPWNSESATWEDAVKSQHFFWVIIAKEASPKSNPRETLGKPKLRETFQCHWAIIFKRSILIKILKRPRTALDQRRLMRGWQVQCKTLDWKFLLWRIFVQTTGSSLIRIGKTWYVWRLNGNKIAKLISWFLWFYHVT